MQSVKTRVCKLYDSQINKTVQRLLEDNVCPLLFLGKRLGNVSEIQNSEDMHRNKSNCGRNNNVNRRLWNYCKSHYSCDIENRWMNLKSSFTHGYSRLAKEKDFSFLCRTYSSQAQGRARQGLPKKLPLPGVKYVIAVASGKGGVGKSSTAVSLALALAQEPEVENVGLLDADIYGPSIPMLMNLSGQPELNHQNLMIPLMNYGIKCMSMGFLVDEKSAIVWRGLMVMSPIQKLLREVAWGPLDYLIVDLPPGTGDVQLSIVQNIPVSGSVIVTTPQDLALLDARRAMDMFDKVSVPALGVVENMSVFVCPCCGHHEHIFGQNGVNFVTEEMRAEILGQVPLQSFVREACDRGVPVLATSPDCDYSQVFTTIAKSIIRKLKDTPPLTDSH